MKFSIKDFFSKRDQISRKLRIWSHLLKKPLIENFFNRKLFCAVGAALWDSLESLLALLVLLCVGN